MSSSSVAIASPALPRCQSRAAARKTLTKPCISAVGLSGCIRAALHRADRMMQSGRRLERHARLGAAIQKARQIGRGREGLRRESAGAHLGAPASTRRAARGRHRSEVRNTPSRLRAAPSSIGAASAARVHLEFAHRHRAAAAPRGRRNSSRGSTSFRRAEGTMKRPSAQECGPAR